MAYTITRAATLYIYHPPKMKKDMKPKELPSSRPHTLRFELFSVRCSCGLEKEGEKKKKSCASLYTSTSASTLKYSGNNSTIPAVLSITSNHKKGTLEFVVMFDLSHLFILNAGFSNSSGDTVLPWELQSSVQHT